jgi:hypothetical protein
MQRAGLNGDKNRSLLQLYAPWHRSLAKRLKQHRDSAILVERCLSKHPTHVADAAPSSYAMSPPFHTQPLHIKHPFITQ